MSEDLWMLSEEKQVGPAAGIRCTMSLGSYLDSTAMMMVLVVNGGSELK